MKRKSKQSGSNTDSRKLARGEGPFSSKSKKKSRELGEIMAFSASHNAYTVVTRGAPGNPNQSGGGALNGVPRKVDNPGLVSPLPVGTTVVIDWDLGFPIIDGVLPVNMTQSKVEGGVSASANVGGATSVAVPDDNTEQEHSAYYRQPGSPKDAIPGDQLLITPDGNRVGALRGGYNVMDGGPGTKAKIETFGDRDLVRMTTEDYEMFTAFGILNIVNAEGRCGLTFRAGADQLSESGGDDEQWTFKVDIGDTGDYFTMEVCTPDGATQAKAQMSANGRVTLLATDGLDLVDGGKTMSHQEYAADLMVRVLGSIKKIVEGSITETFKSSRKTTVSENDQKTVGHNEATSINNHHIMNVGGNQQVQISGGAPLNASPLNVAVDMQVLNGSYKLELGNPTAGANPLAMAGFTVAVNNGDITLGQNPDPLSIPATRASVSLNTILPSSVALGGTTSPLTTNPAIFHAVMYEPLLILLTAMMALYDVHVHIPPIVGPPATLMSPTLSTLLSTLMSTRVLIGG